MLDVVFGQASDPRTVRRKNEGAMGSFVPGSRRQIRSHGFLFAVAEGAGESDRGEAASAIAISVLMQEFETAQSNAMLISLLPMLLQNAYKAVRDLSLIPEFCEKNVATTLAACALRYDQAVVSHIGDSRCYLVRKGVAKQITQDHVYAIDPENLTPASSLGDSHTEASHASERFLNQKLFVSPDTSVLTIHPGDLLVLCSAGLHKTMQELEIAALVSHCKPVDEIARQLVARAVEINGNENSAAQVIRIRDTQSAGVYRGHAGA